MVTEGAESCGPFLLFGWMKWKIPHQNLLNS
jgi:hypothetical protein